VWRKRSVYELWELANHCVDMLEEAEMVVALLVARSRVVASQCVLLL
jgi:hypothetical protein